VCKDPDVYNRFFASVSYCPSKQTSFLDNVAVTTGPDDAELDDLPACDDLELSNIFRKIKNTSPGLDGLPAWLFRNCNVELANVFSATFNQSLRAGKVPTDWLTAVVTPVAKIDKPTCITDFRPISVTPILSRTLESIVVKKYLQPSLSADLHRDQYAYKVTASTCCALIDILHFVTRSLESCSYVRCMMIDLSKAFDIVDRKILLSKLAALTVPKSIAKWISNFLSERQQVVRINDQVSDPLSVNQGVVQGSALGPTLFSIMISDLKPISSANGLVKFADDLTLLVPQHSDVDLADEFNAIKCWITTNNLKINLTKTKELVFHRPRPGKLIFPPPLDGIERVMIAKLLGVTLDASLSFSEHVSNIIRLCTQRTFLLRTLKRRGMKLNSLEALLKTLIVSRILYAISAWGGFINSAERGRIDAMFMRCKRFGYCKDANTFERLLMKADQRLFSKAQGESHCINHLLPAIRNSTHQLRERGHPYVLPQCSYNLHRRSFLVRMLFNNIQ
jgi:hypothetical protein